MPPVPPNLVIVLSAGGPVAWMFHLGVLAGIESSGYRLTDAHFIGTSAGSAVAASVKSGAALDDVRQAILAPPGDGDRREIINTLRETRRQLSDRKIIDRVRPLSPRFLRAALPGGRGVAMALAGALPSGFFPTDPLNTLPELVGTDTWPDGLWIPAVDAADGNVMVFGRDASEASVSSAVEASSAVPGMFQPKQLDGREFIDGAVSSSTHAALAAEVAPDLVVVSSVQTRAGRRPVRIGARRRLAEEIAALEARDIEVVVVEPDQDAIANEKVLLRTGFPTFPGADAIIAAGQRLAQSALVDAGAATASAN